MKIDEKFRAVHYPRNREKWDAEKNEIREMAYTAAHLYGPKMATLFHIKKYNCDVAVCGMPITGMDVDFKAKAHAWIDHKGGLWVPCAECYNGRELMNATTAPKVEEGEFPFDDALEAEVVAAKLKAAQPRHAKFTRYTEEEVSDAMEFWGEWPTMEKIELDVPELVEHAEASGLNVIEIDEDTDFSKLPSLGELLGSEGE